MADITDGLRRLYDDEVSLLDLMGQLKKANGGETLVALFSQGGTPTLMPIPGVEAWRSLFFVAEGRIMFYAAPNDH